MRTLMETNEGDEWKPVENPTQEFLTINDKTKELVELLRKEFPKGCTATIMTFNMEDESAPYWTLHVEPDENGVP